MHLEKATWKEQVNLLEDKWSEVRNGWKKTIKKGLQKIKFMFFEVFKLAQN